MRRQNGGLRYLLMAIAGFALAVAFALFTH
jgi:hypothetical protein